MFSDLSEIICEPDSIARDFDVEQKGSASFPKAFADRHKDIAKHHKAFAKRHKAFASQHKAFADRHKDFDS